MDECSFQFTAGCDSFIYHNFSIANAGLYLYDSLYHEFSFTYENGLNNTFTFTVNENYTFNELSPAVGFAYRVVLLHGERLTNISIDIDHGKMKLYFSISHSL